jgi:hypothetical protein
VYEDLKSRVTIKSFCEFQEKEQLFFYKELPGWFCSGGSVSVVINILLLVATP